MCGFSGEITFDQTQASIEAVGRMTEQLAPRGPDGMGIHAQGRVGLGHRRLKIIDLSERAQQPMTDPEKQFPLIRYSFGLRSKTGFSQ